MATHFADYLAAMVRAKKTALCVGLDPRWESLPAEIRGAYGCQTLEDVAAAFQDFCCEVIRLVAGIVPVVKPNSAFFEVAGPAGMEALRRVINVAKSHGLVVILDAKRGDIASTATAYAEAAFGGGTFEGRTLPVFDADALTINPYLGSDAVEPFIIQARRHGRGIFVLVRTSNPGANLFQDLECRHRMTVCEHVCDEVSQWSSSNIGTCGFGDVGAVVGATNPQEIINLRERAPDVIFLVPGYGAQGGTVADVRAALRPDGLGAVVNSSRGITFPFKPNDPDWRQQIIAAAALSARELSVP